ncbi:MAG: hypothetical protein KIS92_22780 [Planctomycetota bacterium]|nr:hypothetical protein [Planctomycetota bacterium]
MEPEVPFLQPQPAPPAPSDAEASRVLAGALSVDFNNQLTVILGRAQMGRMFASGDPRLAAVFDQIMAASERASAVARQIFAVTQTGDPRGVTLNLDQLAEEILPKARRLLGARFDALLRLPATNARVSGSAMELEQLLLLLLLHVREILPDGGIVELALDTVDAKGGLRAGRFARVCTRYRTEGCHPLEPIGALAPYRSSHQRGSGLSLTVASLLAARHGGSLEVSGTSWGRTAIVLLPLAAPQNAECLTQGATA